MGFVFTLLSHLNSLSPQFRLIRGSLFLPSPTELSPGKFKIQMPFKPLHPILKQVYKTSGLTENNIYKHLHFISVNGCKNVNHQTSFSQGFVNFHTIKQKKGIRNVSRKLKIANRREFKDCLKKIAVHNKFSGSEVVPCFHC